MATTFRELGESAQNATLRPVVAAIESALLRLPPGTVNDDGALQGLRASWAELVGILALGPAPEMRACPRCGRGGLRAATRCRFCWATLPDVGSGQPANTPAGLVDGG